MREQWYADKRDLVKWATLIHIAKSRGLKTILQVAMLRPSEKPEYLQTSDGRVHFPGDVWNHFRTVKNIEFLGQVTGVRIKVFAQDFLPKIDGRENSRPTYFEELDRELEGLKGSQLVVFLDPDTGLAPQRCGPKHVRRDEIAQIFRQMKRGDWLVLYQHARREQDWQRKAGTAFAMSVGLNTNEVKRFLCPKLTKDVVLLAVEKTPA